MKEEKIETPAKSTLLSYGPPFTFDEPDKRLLRLLDENARAQLAELSRGVGLSRDAVRHRIEKLVAADVILAFKPVYNPPRMGFPIVNYVFFSLYNPSEDAERAFVAYLKSNKNVTYVASLLGKWDYIVDIIAEDQGAFDRVLKDIRRKFPDLIKDYEAYGVLQEHKYEEIGRIIYD